MALICSHDRLVKFAQDRAHATLELELEARGPGPEPGCAATSAYAPAPAGLKPGGVPPFPHANYTTHVKGALLFPEALPQACQCQCPWPARLFIGRAPCPLFSLQRCLRQPAWGDGGPTTYHRPACDASYDSDSRVAALPRVTFDPAPCRFGRAHVSRIRRYAETGYSFSPRTTLVSCGGNVI